jgi:single-strand DNA-binding protein
MANSLNKATLIGNLTRDPELRKTAGGQSVTSFSIATNRVFTTAAGEKKDQADYHNIVAWGRLAEICAQYLTKGKKVYVDGRIQSREWEGQDGVKRYRTEIVAENLIMLDRPSAGQGGGSYQKAEGSSSVPQMDDAPLPPAEDEIKLEDIPF